MKDTEFSPNLQDIPEELTPFNVRESSGRQGLMKLMIGFGILLIAAIIVLKLYQPGVRDRGDPPMITADNTPFKFTPDEVGGAQTPHQDKSIFDVMEGKNPLSSAVTPAQEPEAPIDLPAPEPIGNSASSAAQGANVPVPSLKPHGKASTVAPEQPVKSAGAITKPPAVVPTQPVKSFNASTSRSVNTGNSGISMGNSEFVVQVASVRSQRDARNVWTQINAQFNDITSQGLYADVAEVDLGEKGIYFRTRIAGLADKPSAAKLCQIFKTQGQACFVTRR